MIIKKAGTTILAVSILLWAMMTFPGLPEEQTLLLETRRLEILETAGVSARDVEKHCPDASGNPERIA